MAAKGPSFLPPRFSEMPVTTSLPATSLVRSRSVPQPLMGMASVSAARPSIQRSISHMDVRKDSGPRRRGSTELTESKRDGGPFNLSGFFPTSLSAIRGEGEEWVWWRGDGEEGKEEEDRERREEEGPLREGWSALFGAETSEAIMGEDKLGVLMLGDQVIRARAWCSILGADRGTIEDVSLFGGPAEESEAGSGQLLSPYAGDEVVDETSLYLAQRTRRERSDMGGNGSTVVGDQGMPLCRDTEFPR